MKPIEALKTNLHYTAFNDYIQYKIELYYNMKLPIPRIGVIDAMEKWYYNENSYL